LDTITLTGAATQSITTGANSTNNFSINGSAATGALTLNATAYTTNGVSLTGGTAADTLTGSAQADNISGGAGNDTLSGLGGTDTISGGDGTDTITGGAGADNLTGGAGVDTFVYTTLTDSLAAAPDRITDLVAGTDKIDVATLPAAILQGASFTAAGTGNLGTDIAAALTAGGGTFAANGAAVVTITGTGAGTYMVINDGTAGYLAADDAVVNITGITGTLAVADFV
jgi:Ca2+-binding RTX toxin-like protein